MKNGKKTRYLWYCISHGTYGVSIQAKAKHHRQRCTIKKTDIPYDEMKNRGRTSFPMPIASAGSGSR